jgi:hypothetical protein
MINAFRLWNVIDGPNGETIRLAASDDDFVVFVIVRSA